MKFSLKDGAPRKPGEAELFVSKNANTLEIGLVGQEESPPIVIEHYDGVVKLRVFGVDGSPDIVQTLRSQYKALATAASGSAAEYGKEYRDEPSEPVGGPAVNGKGVLGHMRESKRTFTLDNEGHQTPPPPFAPAESVALVQQDERSGMYYGKNLTQEQINHNRSLSGGIGTRVERPGPFGAVPTNGTPHSGYGGRPGFQGTIDPYANDNG